MSRFYEVQEGTLKWYTYKKVTKERGVDHQTRRLGRYLPISHGSENYGWQMEIVDHLVFS